MPANEVTHTDVGVSEMSAAEPSITPIDYARQAPRSRRLLRKLWLPAFLLLVLASAYWWGPPAWHRVQLAYWYDRCLAHVAPPDTVVGEIWSPFGLESAPPPYVPPAWQRLYGRLSSPGFRSGGTAFLGARRAPDGRELLVAVDLIPVNPWATALEREHAVFHVRAFTHSGLPNLPRQVLDTRAAVPVGASRVWLIAGQPDPNDPTHFTITYTAADGLYLGTIHGWVRTGGIQLEATPPPTTQITRPLPKSPG